MKPYREEQGIQEKQVQEKQIEDRIETVLGRLGRVEPAAGMQQRVRAAVERSASAAACAPQRSWWATPQLAAVVAVLIAAGLVANHAHRHGIARHDAGAARATNRSLMYGGPARIASAPTSSATHATAPRLHHADPPSHALAAIDAPTPATPEEQSFPAPPLPLTRQEQLLIQLVHRDDPVQLAQLTPAAREQALQRDREEMREFFRPPPFPAADFKLEPYPAPGGTQ